MKLDIYLNYRGNCEQAFRFYEQHLGGRITMMMRHGPAAEPGQPTGRLEEGHPPRPHRDRQDRAHGRRHPEAEPMRSAYLTLSVDSDEEAERLYALLSDGGQIFMKMEETFFASRFAMLRDRFGTSWMLLHERQPAGAA